MKGDSALSRSGLDASRMPTQIQCGPNAGNQGVRTEWLLQQRVTEAEFL